MHASSVPNKKMALIFIPLFSAVGHEILLERMSQKSKIKSLESLAYKVLLEDLKSWLLFCSKSASKQGQKRKLTSADPIKEISKFYKPRLDKLLTDSLRLKLVVDFTKEFSTKFDKGKEDQPDVCLFLDLVLHESCTELELQLPASYVDRQLDPNKVIKTLVKRTPHMEKLRLSFTSFAEPPYIKPMTVAMETAFCKYLLKFENLTYLNLLWNTSDNTVPFFSCIGTSCPQVVNKIIPRNLVILLIICYFYFLLFS